MKKFLIQVLIFTIPIIFTWSIILLIDPHNLYNISKIISNDSKLLIINRSFETQVRGNVLWKIFEFKRNPCKNIIIGDSQSYYMNEELIKKLTGSEYYNLSIPGANVDTKFTFFWFATTQTKLSNVIIQLSFPSLVMNKRENVFHFAQDYMDKPYQYLFNSAVIKDIYQNIRYKISKKYEKEINQFEFPISKNGNKLFDLSLEGMHKNFKYPNNYSEELEKIVNYCERNQISLKFVLFPIHKRYYNYLIENNLIKYYDQFITEMNTTGKTYNYSKDSTIINHDKNFIDFFHQNQSITDSLTSLVLRETNSQILNIINNEFETK